MQPYQTLTIFNNVVTLNQMSLPRWVTPWRRAATPAPERAKGQSIQTSEALMGFLLGGGESSAGIAVTHASAMRHAAAYACVYILAESVAQLPLILYRSLTRGKERAKKVSLYEILHRKPNSWQTSFEYREQAMRHLLLRGNHYALQNRDGGGELREIIPLHPDTVTVEQRQDLSLVYKVRRPQAGEIIYRQDQIFHVRARSDNGVLGVSPITEARESFGSAMAADDFGGRTFRNRAIPGGVLEHPAELAKEKRDQLKREWQEGFGGQNIGSTAVLDQGLKFTPIAMTNEDAQFIEIMNYRRRDIAAIFRVPPYKIGDTQQQPKANVEQQGLEFVQESLMPWLVRWEQAIARDLIKDASGLYAEFNLSGLLRGDVKTQTEAFKTGVMFGWLNDNEVRDMLGLNPREGGDEFLTPANLSLAGDDGTGSARDVAPDAGTRSRAALKLDVPEPPPPADINAPERAGDLADTQQPKKAIDDADVSKLRLIK